MTRSRWDRAFREAAVGMSGEERVWLAVTFRTLRDLRLRAGTEARDEAEALIQSAHLDVLAEAAGFDPEGLRHLAKRLLNGEGGLRP